MVGGAHREKIRTEDSAWSAHFNHAVLRIMDPGDPKKTGSDRIRIRTTACFYTLTSGNNLTNKFCSGWPIHIRPLCKVSASELELAEAIWFMGDIYTKVTQKKLGYKWKRSTLRIINLWRDLIPWLGDLLFLLSLLNYSRLFLLTTEKHIFFYKDEENIKNQHFSMTSLGAENIQSYSMK